MSEPAVMTKSWPIRFEDKQYWWDVPRISGADIKKLVVDSTLPTYPPSDYALIQDLGSWNLRTISDATAVDLRLEETQASNFYVVPPATIWPCRPL